MLVVEDNVLNQIVAVGILDRLGCDADVVDNGRDAVAAATRGAYGVVLMDCRLPGLDGFQATAEIRRREGAGRHVPIVAMTASASQQDRERCLAAGMDDYLSKPVDRRLLERFKPGALLVNTARGGLVDAEALLWALDGGILRGAGLDVLEGEELLTEDRRLLAERNPADHGVPTSETSVSSEDGQARMRQSIR